MNIAHILRNSFIYGPGCRLVIWVQGCSIRCKGCWNKDLWSFAPKKIMTVSQIVDIIHEEKNTIEGVTILGGEPFDQYDELLELCMHIHNAGLSIILYTGYTLEYIIQNNMSGILVYIDILIDGPYIEKYRNITTGGLIGSSNQRIHFLSERYKPEDLPTVNETEIEIDEHGKITIVGYKAIDSKIF